MRTTRLVARVATLALATGGAVAVGAVAPAVAGSGTYSQPGAVTIGQASSTVGGGAIVVPTDGTATPYPSTVSVSGLVGTVTDVNLRLENLTHSVPDDLDIMLVSPSGKRAVVMSDAGGSNALTDVDITLDDQATQDLPDTTVIASGTYRPKNYEPGDPFAAPAPDPSVAGSTMSVFNDSAPNGVWQLFVLDDRLGDGGAISEWRLEVTTTGTQPYPSALTVSGAEKQITSVKVLLNGLTHTAPADVDMLLVGPAGQQATILSDVGADTDVSGVNLVLDDAASTAVPSPMVSGTYRPTNLGATPDSFPVPAPTPTGDSGLAVFNGTDPNGTWKLYVVDDTPGDTGALAAGWALQITTVDITGPTVVSTKPASAKTGVSRKVNVTATFNEKVKAKTVTTKTFYLERVSNGDRVKATVTYDKQTKKATLDPKGKLRAHTKYRAVVTVKVKDLAGNPLDQNPSKAGDQRKAWKFTTR